MNHSNIDVGNSIYRSPVLPAFLFIAVLLTCFALSPAAQAALNPAPDGGYTNNNTAEGTDALYSLTSGINNTAIGFNALYSNTTGINNTAIGPDALVGNTTGDSNTATGVIALYSNTTGSFNTANGNEALFTNTTGNRNTAIGSDALYRNTTGGDNTATGYEALFNNTTGESNTATGFEALFSNTGGFGNTANGFEALLSNTGSVNTANGLNALYNNTTGSSNIALGSNAGFNLTTGNNNIDIGNVGIAGESNTIRIGEQGIQTNTFIVGISESTIPYGVAVVTDASGHLGVRRSSARFKEAIKPMDKASEAILALKPVTFRYKHELDPDCVLQFGLVAEEVAKVNPDLVARDAAGKIYTVRYDEVNAMLLNEFLKEHHKIQEQEAIIAQLRSTITQLQKGMETVVARLKEQDSKIQRVSDQFELTKPAPRTVVNNQ